MKKLEVRLSLSPDRHRLVGQLAEQNHQIYFEYDPAFLLDPIWLSPFKLPPKTGLIQHKDYQSMIKEVKSAVSQWEKYAKSASVSKNTMNRIRSSMNSIRL